MLGFIEISVYGGIMILAIAIIRAALISKLPKRAFVILWLAAILRLILPFEMPFAGSVYTLAGLLHRDNAATTPVFEDVAVQSGNDTVEYYFNGYRQYPRVEAGAEPSCETDGGIKLPWDKIIYFTVATALAGYFGISYVKNIRKFRYSLPLSDKDMSSIARNIGIPKGVRIRQSDEISAPLTYGVFRPVILLPKLILNGEDSESNQRLIDFALMHELTHIRRFDPAIKLLAVAVCCVHWFNPAVWLMAWLLNRDIELSCDEKVVSVFGCDSRADYANALISLEEKRSGVPFYTGFCRNAVQERITAIMKTKKISVLSALAACLVVTCTIGVFATSAESPEISPVTELDVIATGTGDGDLSTCRYSDDGGKTYMSEQEFMDKYGYDGLSWNDKIEWWTYDEFKEWLENEKKNLQACLGSSFRTPSRGEVVWTQQEIDDTIAMYEDMLENIKNGYLYSKDLDGGIVLCSGDANGEYDYEISTQTKNDIIATDDDLGNYRFSDDGGKTFMSEQELMKKYGFDSLIWNNKVNGDTSGNAYQISRSKFFPEYEALGLRYNKTEDALYFGGEKVGYFYDEYEPGAYIRSLMDGGKIGVVALRNGDGKLISLKKTDMPEFNSDSPTTESAVYSSYESEKLSNEEVLKAYGGYGISFNADGKMLYNGRLVRYFCDGVEVGDGFASKYVYLNQSGEVDVYTVREATPNPDGSVDPFGKLTGLRLATEDEFKNLNMAYIVTDENELTLAVEAIPDASNDLWNSTHIIETATAVGTSTNGGTSFEDIFKRYSGLGISFVPSVGGGMGTVYYNGRLVDGFADNSPSGAAFSYIYANTGRGVAHVVYDDNGEPVGIEVK